MSEFRARVEQLSSNYKKSLGNAYRFWSDKSSLIVTECGGRMFLEHQGHEITWSNSDHFRNVRDILYKGRTGRENVSWDDVNRLGGGKIQIAPQELYDGKVPFLQPHLGMYTSYLVNGVLYLTSPDCKESNLTIVEEIKMTGPSTFEIQSHLVNRSPSPTTAAPWLVFQLREPAVVHLTRLTGAPETFINSVFEQNLPEDVLGSLSKTSFFLSLDQGDKMFKEGKMFKVGYNFSSRGTKARQNITVYFPNENTRLSFEAENIKGKFPHGYRGETYGSPDYFEQEVLARNRYIRFGQISDILKVTFSLASIN